MSATPNLIITTDIGGDPDDQQSMRRLMLYSHEFRLLGLIASATGTPNNRLPPQTRPELIREVIQDYAAVRESLSRHAPGFPEAEYLQGLVRSGNPRRGLDFVGAGHDTEGSEFIVSQVAAAEGLVNVALWGGATDLAQAFFRVRADFPPDAAATWVAKVRIYAIHDQDGLDDQRGDQPSTLAWIREQFPGVWLLESGALALMPTGFSAMYRGMYQNDAPEAKAPLVEEEVALLNQRPWMEEHVLHGHGPLGANYPVVKQNPPSAHNTQGIKEGDTPSWFYFLPHGLNDPAQPSWGGWGGRAKPHSARHFVDAEDAHWSALDDAALRRKWTVARWRRAFQHELAARLDWCVKPFAEANHTPIAVLLGDESRAVLTRDVAAGTEFPLSATGSRDPDGDALTYHWWVYREAGTYPGEAALKGADSETAALAVPADAAGMTIHVILEITDTGAPPLTAYRRLVLEVR